MRAVATQYHFTDADLVVRATHAPGAVSPRAAYQALLWDDAVLLDVRSASLRLAEGVVHDDLRPLVVPDEEVAHRFAHPARQRQRALVIAADDATSAAVTEVLSGLGIEASAVAGGFTGWRAAGMPSRP